MTYKYLKDKWEQEIYYFEVDDKGTTNRQIIETRDTIIVSNRPFDELHFCLTDQDIFLSEEKEIDQEEFESVWLRGINPFINDWKDIRSIFRMGEEVTGKIEVLYPYGIIINLNMNRYGITDYMECMKKSGSERIYPGNRIRGKVSGYDDINLWVFIEEPEVIIVS